MKALAEGVGLHLATLAALLALWSPATAQEPPLRRATLVGAWQDAPDVGDGYGELYVIWPGGRLEHRVAASSCAVREQATYGTWALDGTALVITVTRRRVLEGGQLLPNVADDETGCAGRRRLDGATPRDHAVTPPRVVRVELSGLRRDRDRDGAPSLRFGTRRFYLVAAPDDVGH